MALIDEIGNKRHEIHTDQYSMSIGELINLYLDGDLDIHPEFQRIYRWTDHQKTALIESILLGIPLPSLFVAQRDDGVWDVVDGLQRLSTIFSFVGILKDENNQPVEKLTLQKTEYLPSLGGKQWDSDDPDTDIPKEIQRAFKREKVDIKIVKKESERDTKYELFQRLNTGGSKLSEQEVRNCLLIMLDPNVYKWLLRLSESEDFLQTIPLSDKQSDEAYAMELVIRFFVSIYYDEELRRKNSDFHPYITEEMKRIFFQDGFDFDQEESLFRQVFSILNTALSEDVFRKFHKQKNRYEGAFSILLFEFFTPSVAEMIKAGEDQETILEKVVKISSEISSDPDFMQISAKGVRPIQRFVDLKELGLKTF